MAENPTHPTAKIHVYNRKSLPVIQPKPPKHDPSLQQAVRISNTSTVCLQSQAETRRGGGQRSRSLIHVTYDSLPSPCHILGLKSGSNLPPLPYQCQEVSLWFAAEECDDNCQDLTTNFEGKIVWLWDLSWEIIKTDVFYSSLKHGAIIKDYESLAENPVPWG